MQYATNPGYPVNTTLYLPPSPPSPPSQPPKTTRHASQS
jgi:hypothetical protein